MEEIILAIVYTDIDNVLGPNPTYWLPSDLSESIKMQVGIKTITLLTAEQGIIPDSLLIMPFPSLKMKSMIKYLEWEDNSKRGNVAHSAITFLFNEANDVIFYKAIEHLEPIFNQFAQDLIKLEKIKAQRNDFVLLIQNLKNSVLNTIEELRLEETEAFPRLDAEGTKKVQYHFKVIICGDGMVGKSSLILRFTENAFKRTYLSTLGVSVSEKVIKVNDNLVQLILWDIAGQQKFDKMRSAFYKGAYGIFLVFDLTNPSTFHNIMNWYADIKKEIEVSNNGILIGNKSDLSEERKISYDSASRLASAINFDYFETSALSGTNVEKAFELLTHKLYQINK
ncbi:MAG TPA: Rab family GTPase [Candidatus Lokiarchaeia archaeon]